MIIRFNTSMRTNFNHSLMTSDYIDIYIVPSMGREFENGYNNSQVNFTWSVSEF